MCKTTLYLFNCKLDFVEKTLKLKIIESIFKQPNCDYRPPKKCFPSERGETGHEDQEAKSSDTEVRMWVMVPVSPVPLIDRCRAYGTLCQITCGA